MCDFFLFTLEVYQYDHNYFFKLQFNALLYSMFFAKISLGYIVIYQTFTKTIQFNFNLRIFRLKIVL